MSLSRPLLTLCGVLGVLGVLGASSEALASGGTLPDRSYTPDQRYQIISPQLGAEPQNQPSVVDGYLLLAGNASHQLWDIADPFAPVMVSSFVSPYAAGEAESHSVSSARSADGRSLLVTISGKGVDLWDLTDPTSPELLSALVIEGIDYGDNTAAVWGVAWQGDFIFVGGTDTGLHVVDASDPRHPEVVAHLSTTELGGVSAGPVQAIGNLLVVTTPKQHAGIATVDIGDPRSPALLDSVLPPDNSYIGGFYGAHAYLLTPFRTYDVTSDPTDIRLLGSAESPLSEYMSFSDGFLFLGSLRPNGGQFKVPLPAADATVLDTSVFIAGRRDPDDLIKTIFSDDQFSLAIGNLLVMSDDEVNIGSVLAVHDTQRDSTPPAVLYANPPDGATAQPLTTRVGLSFSDAIDLRTVTPETLIVRPVGGEPLAGMWGLNLTVLNFWPAEPLLPDTTYEVLLPAGGVSDLVGNPVAHEYRAEFSTGADIVAPPCAISARPPALVGAPVAFEAASAGPGALYTWSFGATATGAPAATPATSHVFDAAGRYPVTLTVDVGGASRTCSALQVVHRPLTARPPARSSPVVIDEARALVLVSNPDAGTVSAVDLDTLAPLWEAPAGVSPQDLALAPDGTLWATDSQGDAVVVLDALTGASLDTIALGHGAAPRGLVIDAATATAYVALSGPGAVGALDTTTRSLRQTLALPLDQGFIQPRPRGLALTGDGARLLASRFVSTSYSGTLPQVAEVYDVDTASLSVRGVIALHVDPGPDTDHSGRGVPNYLSAPAILPDGSRAFVAAKKDDTDRGLARDGLASSTSNTVRTVIAPFSLADGADLIDARVDLDDHNLPSAIVPSRSGDLLFVASLGTRVVDVLDAETGRLVSGFSTGLAPDGLALSESGRLFVRNQLDRTLSVYDVAGLLAGTDGAAHHLAELPTVAQEPLEPQILLGKQLFHDAQSRQMSQDGYISCATCHFEGAEDGRVWDFTGRGEGYRNTIDLRGRAGVAHGPLHWTANFDEVQDFENDIRFHFGGTGLMSDEAFEGDGHDDPLGAPKAGLSASLDALAAYVTSLDTFPRSPYRNPDGTRTAAAVAGEELFRSLDCLDCHSGQQLTDSAPGVRHDVGTWRETSGQRLGGPLDGFDTPTLRGVWASAPYLHDGSAPALRHVLENPAHVGVASQLPPERREELEAFLLQLEDEPIELERLPRWEPTPPLDLVDPPGEGGGGCQGGPSSLPWAGALLVLALLVRRRRTV
ncbi:MAG: Ig-like domain-containing protein [Deltaproteobacteria bacterium]|nr:Ig-like domain-containing protein [Deltaproteobacteria bacterium]